ncbi:hypothetical protein AAFF_G00099810 [Aldrovandia affinis]|uniref:Uncharacterized protein n=1 Tax=Aldrovandia affinis TaxID=143900 RepID=A0AAD7RUZ6_9TELE|nr:hypothetical protein AAFF_G00099810 [Aldrovandia affinis]
MPSVHTSPGGPVTAVSCKRWSAGPRALWRSLGLEQRATGPVKQLVTAILEGQAGSPGRQTLAELIELHDFCQVRSHQSGDVVHLRTFGTESTHTVTAEFCWFCA